MSCSGRDRVLVGNPFGNPLVVLDLGVDFFALLAHVPTTRPPAIVFSLSAKRSPAALFVTAPKETTALRAPYLIRQQRN